MQYLDFGSRLPNIKQHPGVIEIRAQMLMRFVGSERIFYLPPKAIDLFTVRKTFSLKKNILN